MAFNKVKLFYPKVWLCTKKISIKFYFTKKITILASAKKNGNE